MSFALCYWILMLLWLVFGVWSNWPVQGNWRGAGGFLIPFLLFLIVGWSEFGAPLHR